MKIAIDIDNTILDYSQSILYYLEHNLPEIYNSKLKNKKTNYLKKLIKSEKGDLAWQNCQGFIYSDKTNRVKFYDDALNFLQKSIKKEVDIYFVIHKTKFGLHSAKNINIKNISKGRLFQWLIDNNLIKHIESIFFTETLEEKINFLKLVAPDYLIDDLIDIHLRYLNPKNYNFTKSILFSSDINEIEKYKQRIIIKETWESISKLIYG